MSETGERYKYSVVVPVYNGEHTIRELFLRIKHLFESTNTTFQVVFVEDCGQDNSWKVISDLKREYSDQIIAVKLSRNFGQHNALLCGFNYVDGDFIITIDDDLQVPPEEIPKLIKKQRDSNSELVYGVYGNKKHNPFRNIGSNLVQKIIQHTFKAKGPITSFRLLSFSLCERIRNHKQGFVYIEGLFFWHTENITRVEVEHRKRLVGKSNYSVGKLFRLAINLIFNFTTLPLRVIIGLGILFSIVSFAIGIFFILRKIIYEVPLGYTSIIVSIYFTSSVLLLILGVIGEYLSRLYALQNSRPQFSIKEILK